MNGSDYALPVEWAREMLGVSSLPHDLRTQALESFRRNYGAEALVQLCSHLIGMTNSIIENSREMTELLLITEGNVFPDTAAKANLPTLFGALQGVILADGIKTAKVCGGCAYRLGTSANQSPSTTCDAEYVLDDQAVFYCHEDLDEGGNPLHACPGYAQALKRRKIAA